MRPSQGIRHAVQPYARSLMRARVVLLAVLGYPVPWGAAEAGEVRLGADSDGPVGAPLRVRNLSPTTALFGLPRPLGALPARGGGDIAVIVEHGNNFTANQRGDTEVFLDGTTTITSLAVRRAVGERWSFGLELPFVHHGGGFTDGLIDGFHDVFGFPDGGRERAPRDRMDYRIVVAGEELVALDDGTDHVGDARAWLGYRLHASTGRHGALRAMIKAPTGEVATLSGSGATDAALWAEWVDGRTLQRLSLSLTMMAGLTVPGDGDLAVGAQEDVVYSGHLGLHLPLGRRVTVRVQLDAHSDVVDGGVPQLGSGTLQGTLGGTAQVSRSLWLDLGVSEDLDGASAPDVVFLVTLGTRF